jgi:hypothetical protein
MDQQDYQFTLEEMTVGRFKSDMGVEKEEE